MAPGPSPIEFEIATANTYGINRQTAITFKQEGKYVLQFDMRKLINSIWNKKKWLIMEGVYYCAVLKERL
jgi:hypothetical protein